LPDIKETLAVSPVAYALMLNLVPKTVVCIPAASTWKGFFPSCFTSKYASPSSFTVLFPWNDFA
jgi:hypothetical protein